MKCNGAPEFPRKYLDRTRSCTHKRGLDHHHRQGAYVQGSGQPDAFDWAEELAAQNGLSDRIEFH